MGEGNRDDRRRIVAVVSGGHFLSHFYFLALPPLFPLLVRDFGLSNTQLGLLVSAINLPVLLLQIPMGEVVDRIGAGYVFVAGVVVTSASVLLAGFAPVYPALLLLALCSGVGQSTFHPSDYALLESVVEEGNEGKSFSVHTFGGYAGFAAAPVVVGGLGLAVGWRLALSVAGLLGVAYALVALVVLNPREEYRREQERREQDGADDGRVTGLEELRTVVTPSLLALFAFFAVLFMAGTGIQSFTTVFLVETFDVAEATGNSALTAFFALSAAGVLVGGPLADRYEIHAVASASLAFAGVAIWVLVSRTFPLSSVVIVGLLSSAGFFSGLMRPSRDRLVSSYAPPDTTGKSFGFVFTGGSLGSFVSPVALGAIIDAANALLSFAIIGGFFFVCAAIVVAIRVSTRPAAVRSRTA